MSKIKVLLAEDESALAHIVRESLEERDFEVLLCADGLQALEKYRQHRPHILALDVMMPRMDGFETAKQIRQTDTRTPIIFLTAKSQSKDVIAGFELGANDYLKKPFSVEELIIRIRVLLSDNRMLPQAVNTSLPAIKFGQFRLHPQKHLLQYNEQNIQLTARESAILKLLCQNQNSLVERKLLLMQLWGDDSFFNARSLDVFIAKLRRYLEADTEVQIITLRGIGYKLVV